MWVARQNTKFDRFASYYMSLNKMEIIQYEAYTKPEHTFMMIGKSEMICLLLDQKSLNKHLE